MSTITIEEFRACWDWATEEDYSDIKVQMFIDLAGCEMDKPKWGCWFEYAQCNLVAHYLVVNQVAVGDDAAAGLDPIQRKVNELEGDTAVAYAAGAGINGGVPGMGTDDMLASTLFGRQYIELRSKASPRGMSTGRQPFVSTRRGFV